MQVRLLTSLSGPTGSWAEGDLYSCDDDTAKRMIDRGQAIPASVGGVELAVSGGGVERAVKPKGRARV